MSSEQADFEAAPTPAIEHVPDETFPIATTVERPPFRGCLQQILAEGASYRTDEDAPVVYRGETSCRSCEQPTVTDTIGVSIPACPISGECEDFWLGRYPDEYTEPDSTAQYDRLGCANCAGQFALAYETDGVLAEVRRIGSCRVDQAGVTFKRFGTSALTMTKPLPLGDEIPEFDGAGSAADAATSSDRQYSVSSCVGDFLTEGVALGIPAAAGVYACPRSIDSGEHCSQTLRQNSDGTVTRADDNTDWSDTCILNRTTE